jgi:rhodanese-related sulfurtransferase
MNRRTFTAIGVSILLGASALFAFGAWAKEPLRITKEELRQRLDNGKVVVVDVRTGGSWVNSDRKIAGAVREDPEDVNSWAKRYAKGNPLVLYCA